MHQHQHCCCLFLVIRGASQSFQCELSTCRQHPDPAPTSARPHAPASCEKTHASQSRHPGCNACNARATCAGNVCVCVCVWGGGTDNGKRETKEEQSINMCLCLAATYARYQVSRAGMAPFVLHTSNCSCSRPPTQRVVSCCTPEYIRTLSSSGRSSLVPLLPLTSAVSSTIRAVSIDARNVTVIRTQQSEWLMSTV